MLALRGEAKAQAGDLALKLVFDNAAWCVVEEVLDRSYADVLRELFEAELLGNTPKLKVTGALLFAATRREHPELTLEQCRDLMMAHPGDLGDPLGAAMRGSLPKNEAAEPGEAKPAPEATPAPDGTGATS